MRNRRQRIKINTTFSTAVSQEINDFADGPAPFVCDKRLDRVLDKSEENSELAIFWFENSYMKLNTAKCHLLVSGTRYEYSWAKIGDHKTWDINEIKLLGVTIDNRLKFDSPIKDICLKAS